MFAYCILSYAVHWRLHSCASPALPVPSTLAVFCPAEEDSVWRIQWPEAAPGSTQSVRCPGEGDTPGLGLAHRSCLAGGVWGSVDVRDCESLAVRDIRIQVCVYLLGHDYPIV